MSKHARFTLTLDRIRQEPKHSLEWTRMAAYWDQLLRDVPTSGKHARPFAKHHPATPVTYNAPSRLHPIKLWATPALDVAA